MNKKVYFSGSIRGGRQDADLYIRIIGFIKKTDTVLTEHVGSLHLLSGDIAKDDEGIYLQDTGWLKESDLVIAECSTPSLGVGYELAYAEKLQIPVYIFYRKGIGLSAMLKGNRYFHCFAYENEEELLNRIAEILNNEKAS